MPRFLMVMIFYLLSVAAMGQKSYVLSDKVANFSFKKILNDKGGHSDFSSLQRNITILDFFATWCVPCIKAIPGLSAMQDKFPGKLSVVLISTEDELRLKKFLNQRPDFSFPVVVDNGGTISNLFQPPSFPYTIVLNSESKIIAITEAGSITEAKVNEWLSGKSSISAEKISYTNTNPQPVNSMNSTLRSSNKLVALSQNLVYAAKTGEPVDRFTEDLKKISYSALLTTLENDDAKKSFWINIYNGYTQVLLKTNPAAYKNRSKFFKSRHIELAGKKFSLDDIEHGILRRGKIKWSLGYLNKLFPRKAEKDLQVDKLDYRLHFALNCGAKSCPPIAFYDPSDIGRQLDIATTAYLKGEAEYNAQKNRLGLPAIMGWFRRDFGGKKKMLELVKQKGIVPQAAKPTVHFNKYNWELHLNNFQQ